MFMDHIVTHDVQLMCIVSRKMKSEKETLDVTTLHLL